MSGCGFCDEGVSDLRCTCDDDDPDTEQFSMPDAPLTPDRIREALLLLQAVGESPDLRIIHRDGLVQIATWSTEHSERVWNNAPTLAEALTGLLDALGVEAWEWPSDKAVQAKLGRLWFLADLRDLFAREPLTVIAMLGGGPRA